MKNISAGNKIPQEFNVIIEIPMHGHTKYEIDYESGLLQVDRFLPVAMHYPYNYGFIPQTLTGDGDPCDVFVITEEPIFPQALIECRPIGLLNMTDESGPDQKILCLPKKKIDLMYPNVESIKDIPQMILDKIEHFLTYYKKLEKDKWVEIGAWEDKDSAIQFIEKSLLKK